MRYTLYTEQQLSCTLEEAWVFFSSPHNLSKITPKNMGFTVLSKSADQPIYNGMEIDYTVSPLLRIPLRWKTLITDVHPQKSFSDYQKKGPYKYWNHFHEFIPNDEGVLMIDRVEYELPFGILGRFAHWLLVKKKLNEIFEYRYTVLNKIFNYKI